MAPARSEERPALQPGSAGGRGGVNEQPVRDTSKGNQGDGPRGTEQTHSPEQQRGGEQNRRETKDSRDDGRIPYRDGDNRDSAQGRSGKEGERQGESDKGREQGRNGQPGDRDGGRLAKTADNRETVRKKGIEENEASAERNTRNIEAGQREEMTVVTDGKVQWIPDVTGSRWALELMSCAAAAEVREPTIDR